MVEAAGQSIGDGLRQCRSNHHETIACTGDQSNERFVGRDSKCAVGFAPLLKASSTSACPIPRLAPVTRTALSAIVINSAPVSRCSYDD